MEDKERLQNFIDELRGLFSNQLIENRRELFSNYETLENADFYEDLVAAWDSLQENFEILRSEIGATDINRLRELGLANAQLRLKLNVFKDLLGKGWVKKAIGVGGTIVGTIAEELGVAEPIKEFIEIVGTSIKD